MAIYAWRKPTTAIWPHLNSKGVGIYGYTDLGWIVIFLRAVGPSMLGFMLFSRESALRRLTPKQQNKPTPSIRQYRNDPADTGRHGGLLRESALRGYRLFEGRSLRRADSLRALRVGAPATIRLGLSAETNPKTAKPNPRLKCKQHRNDPDYTGRHGGLRQIMYHGSG